MSFFTLSFPGFSFVTEKLSFLVKFRVSWSLRLIINESTKMAHVIVILESS